MKVTPLKLQGASLLEPVVHGDNRGFFMESYNEEVMEKAGVNFQFIQDNQSLSAEVGVLRGLHYQLNPKAQTKLIRVLSGVIYDVIVDVRRSSPTFGQWVGVILSEYNKRQLLVPKGFAHGFCTLVPSTQVLYKVDEYYSPENDRGILWNDPALGIDWPVSSPILSDKDQRHPLLKDAELNFD
ncbi:MULTISPECIES: dTDP-4-dehydrorhamnose 3,5-epimerase [unclassified Paenibacillus]|uniref:dTDP-4-dehydrorhamnose 3,5-epimerase n=1 Tax=unclassified Paenibacillus TaxID=185978 RepID=UPI002405D94B|nr:MULTISPECIES: dTDP-4-dehydrorhamnose 3,5-epimerase [unclassified Paenibacillus]MDF9840215.1 dTDP-4-dehydrorhamnose 3,5-epimerase [Paenibacillus sp. PastF-2]MDF9846797.1 dTDP-4-dehydrorhamnose 3,5-epimerase [Paenibacillus sp. PastM-2]MDF9852854.1 dTDP-4-dehydrorhamnose 3,5-epimerase [Paenibacillus sp. PastF-1]MDH6478641.1 dTDP-4-dehydrorhamnose 3,5-epimerase [Paenibacillus sp. PastH-2]MDH6505861.1 dTDP-4-dehydrorhamnose 3,5-epimerase [Paenibacillus sp. PastM-3]